MKRRKDKIQPQQEEKILDVNATMQGSLRFDDPVKLRINGKFEGTLDTKGDLMIGSKAEIKANITGESISIEGNVTGNIKASRLLKLLGTAKLSGDVEAPQLSIEEGAILNGQIRMENAGSGKGQRNETFTAGELAKYLEVDSGKITEWITSGVLQGARENGDWVFEKTKIDEWVAQGRVKV